jgi:hypothetical protein
MAGFPGEFEPIAYLNWHPSGRFFLHLQQKELERLALWCSFFLQAVARHFCSILRQIALSSMDLAFAHAPAGWLGFSKDKY